MTNLVTNTLLTHTIHRITFINILETAIRFGEYRFARRAAINWLTDFPGDLHVNYLNVKASIAGKGNPETALSMLHQLVQKDPLFLDAYELALKIALEHNSPAEDSFRNSYYAAGGDTDPERVAGWSKTLRSARRNLLADDIELAESELLAVIAANPPTPLAAVAHINMLERLASRPNTNNLLVRQKIIEHYYERWETCLQIRLYYARSLLESSQPELGVELLHNVVVDDPAGQVVRQLWGENHPYRDLWPSNLAGNITDPLPSSIAAWFGINLLSSTASQSALTGSEQFSYQAAQKAFKQKDETQPGSAGLSFDIHCQPDAKTQPDLDSGSHQKSSSVEPEGLISTSETLDRIANRIHQSDITDSDGRFPVYVIITSSENLARHYGPKGLKQVLTGISELRQSVDNKKNWSALTMLVDDPKSMASLHIKPVRPSDPWAIKRALIDLDYYLAKKGEMIGALLIVGGPQIIPFHCLPNPIDDQDFEIPSDNPYGTRDENYFAPEWPVGRIPGDATNNVNPLIKAIKSAAENHKSQKNSPGWLKKLLTRIKNVLRVRNSNTNNSFGYSAAIWRQASEIVYQQIGDRKKLLVSPPATTEKFSQHHLQNLFAYFNLHGILDSPDWYGHKDPADAEPGPDYPVALRPSDIRRNSMAPLIVFSEACYGANIDGKATTESIPLKFIEAGAHTFIGSTATAYGSVATPLIAADLLSHQFWKFVNQGVPVGEAFRRAKIELVKTMHERQGYLDGEDQKTLISFVLYGDPLLFPLGARRFPKDVYRPLHLSDVQTACDKNNEINLNSIPDETLASVKRIVKQYLPGMDGALIRMNKIHVSCSSADHNCPSSQLHINSKTMDTRNRRVIVVSKQVQSSNREFTQIARMTLDERGKIIKLAMTR